MGRETNIRSIQALEEQIEEGKGDIIKLKRDRNSLLNISTRVPPEILGYIFVWVLGRDNTWSFGRPQKGCYDFLLVCHHWFDVASRTPELWSFWGNTLQDWKKRHHRSKTTPLDLVLDEHRYHPSTSFDEPLRDAIRSRVIQDTIRRVHLSSSGSDVLASVILPLTPGDEGGHNENIESIVWDNQEFPDVDVSNFFARSWLSKLHILELFGTFRISSWDHLASRTTLLTTLSLEVSPSPPSTTLTATRLFSILTSNPNLRKLALSGAAIPDDIDRSASKVQLRNLEFLSLEGEFLSVFGLLCHLVLPAAMDDICLDVFNPTVEDVSQILGPYMQDYFRRDPRFQDRLGVYSSSPSTSATVLVGVVHTQTTTPALGVPRVSLEVEFDLPHPDLLNQLFINLIALVPLEHVGSFNADSRMKPSEELFSMMPRIETLSISDVELSEGFLQPNPGGPYANMKLLPSLRLLRLEDVSFLNNDDWGHLTAYLVHQTSDSQAISLEVVGDFAHICPEAVKKIEDLVEKVTYVPKFRNGRMSGDVLVPDATNFG